MHGFKIVQSRVQNPSPIQELWLKDDLAHTGDDEWDGTFWDSPDLWIRHQDDGGITHQSPVFGQDNWFYARVRNKSSAGACKHWVVTFHAKEYAGTEFVYPADFLPCIAAKAEFELAAGETRIVKASWPQAMVPPAGSHACLLASVIARADHPSSDRHVWEHNNLAQKNLTIADMLPDTFIIIPIVIRNLFREGLRYDLEVWRDRAFRDYEVSLMHTSKDLFSLCNDGKVFRLDSLMEAKQPPPDHLLDCGGHISAPDSNRNNGLLTSDNPDLIARRFPNAFQVSFPAGKKAKIPVALSPFSPSVIGFKVAVPANAKKGTVIKTHFVQRNTKTKQITGGIAVQIMVK